MKKEHNVAKAIIRKRKQRRIRRILKTIFLCLLFLCTGFMIGVHYRVIKALLKGDPLPELPERHPHCCRKGES